MQPRVVVLFGGGRGDDVEALRLEARHRQVAFDPAARAARLRQGHPADLGRQAVRERPVEETLRAGPGDHELGEARLVEHADARAHAAAFLAHGVEPVAATERVLVACRSVPGEPERPLPAEALAEDRAACRQPVVDRVDLQRPPRRKLLFRVVDRVLALVGLAGAWDEIRRRGRVAAEAADVELPHVDARLAVDDPLRGEATRASGEHDPEDAEAGEDVEVAEAGHRPHQAATVGGVGVRAVDDRPDARIREHRQPFGRRRERLLDLVEVRRQQLAVEAVGDALDRPGLRIALERPDQQRLALLPHVVRRVRVTQDRQLALQPHELAQRRRDDVVVLERDERQVGAGEPADLTSPLARRINDDVGTNLSGPRLEQPAAAVAADARHRRPAPDPHVRGATDERVRQPCRIDVAVRRQVRGGDDAARVHERVQVGEPLRRNDVERHSHDLRHRRPLPELVQPILRRGEADAPARVIADGLPGLRLQALVELDGVAQQPHQVIARVELRAQPGCMPGRAGRQLSLLEKDDLVPTELGQVIREAAACDPAADDRDLRILDHSPESSCAQDKG